jgi:hypothetical protein
MFFFVFRASLVMTDHYVCHDDATPVEESSGMYVRYEGILFQRQGHQVGT